MLYDIGDKLKCKKETNTQCLEMCNPCFDIKIGDEYTVTDKSDSPVDSPCYWYELTSGNGDIVLNAWNDEGHMIIDEIFEKVINDDFRSDKMLRCLVDISVSEESKCAKCCLYCDEKETCEYKCHGVDEWKTEEKIAENCIECIEC